MTATPAGGTAPGRDAAGQAPGPARPLRHTPIRRCVVCRESFDKRRLMRLARLASGALVVDLKGTGPGRGAYVCRKTSCWSPAVLAGRLRHALRAPLSADDLALLSTLAADMAEQSQPLAWSLVEGDAVMD